MGSCARYFKRKLLLWAKENTRHFPWRRTRDPYKVCVAEIMLQQTFAAKVVPVYKAFVARYPNSRKLNRANLSYLEKLIRPLGLLYRARTFKKMAKCVVEEFGGRFPSGRADILSLPGVGAYTASAVMCFTGDEQCPIIDTNVVRVYSRYFGINIPLPSSAPDREIEKVSKEALPKGKAREFNYALLDFASAVCKHYNPKCYVCPVRSRCIYFSRKGS